MFRAMLDWRQSFGVDDPWLLDNLMTRMSNIEDEDL